MSTDLIPSPAPAVLPAPLFTPTRKAYLNATRRFSQWCEARGIGELAGVEPFHSPHSSRSCRETFRCPR